MAKHVFTAGWLAEIWFRKVGFTAPDGLSKLGKGTVILVVASDLHEEAPVWWLQVKNAVKRGALLLVVPMAAPPDWINMHLFRSLPFWT